SSKYEDIITNSELIRPGPPAVYKITVGKRNVNKLNKTILLVGETGAGKSTLVNALFNHIMGVKWEDEVWFQVVEEKGKRETESQTPDVIVYEFFSFEDETLPYSLTIIDTPGFGDTRGAEHDVIISQRLLDLFRSADGVHEVNAVGLVMKATDNRLSDRQSYVFDSVMSLFGKNVEKNIVAFLTHSDGMPDSNAVQAIEDFKIKCARDEENQPVHFLFNNRLNIQRTKKTEFVLDTAWKVTNEGMSQFTAFLEKTGPQELVTTVEVLKERVRLTACIQNLQDRIEFIEQKQIEIKQTEGTLKKYEEEMKKNKDFTVEVDESYKAREPTIGGMWFLVFYQGAVCCKICEENCHYPGCTVAWKPAHCEVMKDGRCTACSRKCPASDHVKENWRYVTKTRRVKKTNAEMKQKYTKNQAGHEMGSSLLEDLNKEMNQLTEEKSRYLQEAYQHADRLKKFALKASSVSTYVHLDFLIEKMKEVGDTVKVQELQEMKTQEDTGFMAAVCPQTSKLAIDELKPGQIQQLL
uniref:AIG1-type G domain-containing protein n=1 Tax=Amphiprion percula TaxID=161767 RepID=A0A3P8RHW7_AMPPE